MMPVTGTREMSTKPVTTVPTIAPTVAIPESRPTTVPVSSRVVSISLVTMGVTAASRAPGTTIVTAATITSKPPDSSASPAARTTNGVAATATPDIDSSGAMVRRGGTDVGGPAAVHRPQGDRRERGADDERARLQRQAEVGGQQPERDHLDHEHGPRGPEHQRRCGPWRQAGGWSRGLLAHATIMAGRRRPPAWPAARAQEARAAGRMAGPHALATDRCSASTCAIQPATTSCTSSRLCSLSTSCRSPGKVRRLGPRQPGGHRCGRSRRARPGPPRRGPRHR